MSRALSRDRIEAELATVEQLLTETPASSVLSRTSLESRAKQLREDLGTITARSGTNAEVVLSFEGSPVAGSHGIDARFGTDAVGAYQKLVTAIASRHSAGELGAAGPFPASDASRLHLSNVVHGSFGFELKELDNVLLGPSPLGHAVDRSLEVLSSAVLGGEALALIFEAEGSRVRDAVLGFLNVLDKGGAAVRLVSDARQVMIIGADVGRAVEAVEAVTVTEEEQRIPGVFGGAHLASHRFEHTPPGGSSIYGTLDPGVDPRSVQPWYDRACIAHVRVVMTTAAGKSRRAYVLLGLDP